MGANNPDSRGGPGGRYSVHYTFGLWGEYVAYCRRLAMQAGVSMWELDRAMWQWSNER